MQAPALSILILSEDGASDSHLTIVAIAKKMLRLVDAHCDTQPAKIRFEPLSDKEAGSAVKANLWMSTRATDRQAITSLVKYIATKISEANGFVFFHADGDRVWTQMQTSENHSKFTEIIVGRVSKLLKANGRKPEDHLFRLKLLMPFYSIESWLYQNTEAAIAIATNRHHGRDVNTFQEWASNRAAIDDVPKIKDSICLGSNHNLVLAKTAFPADVAYSAGTSFAYAVDQLKWCPALINALERTYATEE